MHIHILGICGTFMGGIACLAAERGFRVSGQDLCVYPPMSTQLENLGIKLHEGYEADYLQANKPDVVIIGNALRRGLPVVEYVLNERFTYQSGPQWLAENILKDKWVIGVAGTHGKTTTTSMIAWILHCAALEPGFLIGGIPSNFDISARKGEGSFFVVEADEYDCAFFDKRSKFVHYHPNTCVLNNLEFDHADIFQNIDEIKKQFHHLIRTVPSQGALIVPTEDPALQAVLAMGYWSEVKTFGHKGEWQAHLGALDGSLFEVTYQDKKMGTVNWKLIGAHNVQNALASIAASAHAGVPAQLAIEALNQFESVKRRMEVRGKVNEITVYDDFAHHPTAIRTTIAGLRAKIAKQRLIAILDIRSNTLCMGTHQAELAQALSKADAVFVYQSAKVVWDVKAQLAVLGNKAHIYQETQQIVEALVTFSCAGDHLLIMSNGGFDDLHTRLLSALAQNEAKVA